MTDSLRKKLHSLGLVGICSIFIVFLENYSDNFLPGIQLSSNTLLYALIATLSTLLTVVFMYAFVILGKIYNKKLALFSWAFIVIQIVGALIGSQISVGNAAFTIPVVLLIFVIQGIALIFFGIELKKLQGSLGPMSRSAGILNIIAGILYASFIFTSIGLFADLLAKMYMVAVLMRLDKDKTVVQTKQV